MKSWMKVMRQLGDLSLTHLAMFVCMGALGVAALAILAVAKGG